MSKCRRFLTGVGRSAIVLSVYATLQIRPAFIAAGDVSESYDDGKPKLHYKTDDKDRRVGTYEEFHPNGKLKLRGQYTLGKKTGQWSEYDDSGKLMESSAFRNDLLDGAYLWNFPSGKAGLKSQYHNGQLASPLTVMDEKGHITRRVNYPRSRDAVEKAFLSLFPAEKTEVKFTTEPHVGTPYKAGVLAAPPLEAALKLTKLYRYLSGVPWEDMKIDPGLCEKSAHGAVILAKIGSLTHTPAQPADMDQSFFSLAYLGCHEANLFMGDGNPVTSVRAFMDDSDPSNIDRVGHRQWVLSPGLQHVGFGSAGGFASMYVFDGARAVKFDFNVIAFPGEGYYPKALFGANFAWSLHFNTAKVKVGTIDSLKITLQKLDEHYQPTGEAIASKIVSTPGAMSPTFGWSVVVFQPELKELETARYWVDVQGLKSAAGADAPFGYIVDFIDVATPEKVPAANAEK